MLSIAGVDPSGGAGVLADIKTFGAFGAYGAGVVTSLTAQNTQGVQGVHTPPASFFEQQLDSVLDDLQICATKIGMLANEQIATCILDRLARSPHAFGPVVLDTVMRSTSGHRLISADAVEQLLQLAAKSTIITPNLHEAAMLLNCELAQNEHEAVKQAKALVRLGAGYVLLTGGHLQGEIVDVLADDSQHQVFRHARVSTPNTHGTGCTLSSALAARLAGYRSADVDFGTIAQEVVNVSEYLQGALRCGAKMRISKHAESFGPVDHLWNLPASA